MLEMVNSPGYCLTARTLPKYSQDFALMDDQSQPTSLLKLQSQELWGCETSLAICWPQCQCHNNNNNNNNNDYYYCYCYYYYLLLLLLSSSLSGNSQSSFSPPIFL